MIWFRFKQTIKTGVKSIWMHRLRSVLTVLGIVFGVSSVIAMLAVGEGASRAAQEQIARLGSRNLIVQTVKPPEEKTASNQQVSMKEYGLRYSDAERFRDVLPNARVIVPERIMTQQVRYRNRRVAVRVIGTIPWYTDIKPIHLLEGRFLSSVDMVHRQGVCVLDERVARELFAWDDYLGRDVKIKGDYYRVVGVVSTMPDLAGPSPGNRPPRRGSTGSSGGVAGNLYIPLTTARDRFSELSIQAGAGGIRSEKVELQQITVKVARADQVLVTRDLLDSLLSSSSFHRKKDYRIIVPLELLRQAENTKRIFSIVLGSIAAISLLVGGIGIMNIMLASVSERTREIGIRRALGARRRDIIIQFLTETVMLTLLGGLLGVVLGMLIPLLITHFGNMPTAITPTSLVMAFGISAAVGITFGLYPACRAAYMDPIESLRHE